MRNVLTMLLVSVLSPAFLFAQASDQQKLVERSMKELGSRDVETRVEAAEALWIAGEAAKPAIPALRKALDDPEPAVAVRAAGALLAMGEPVSGLAWRLRLVLEQGDENDRFLAARALTGTDPAERLVGPILEYLRSQAPDPQGEGDEEARSANFEAGKDALRKLAATQDPGIATPLLALLSEDSALTAPALAALGELRPPPGGLGLRLFRLLHSSHPETRELVVELLAREPAEADVAMWAAPVAGLVSDPEKRVQLAALRALRSARGLAIEAMGPVARAVREDPDAEIRALAAEAVGEIGDRTLATDAALKIAAAREALPFLKAAIESDESEEVRAKAQQSLKRLELDPAALESAGASPQDRALETLRAKGRPFNEGELHTALSEGELEIVKAFLDAGMSPNHRFAKLFNKPVLYAALSDRNACRFTVRPTPAATKAIVRLLLERGADPNLADERGHTPLMKAVEQCDREVVEMLLAAKADMNARDAAGRTAFEFGFHYETDGAAALADAGFRMSEETAKMYREAYALEPSKMALLKRVTGAK